MKVLIWDVEAQPNRHPMLGATESLPNLVRNEWSSYLLTSPYLQILTGKDKSVVLWSIHDHISSLSESLSKLPVSSTPNSTGKQPTKAGNVKSSGSPTVGPRGVYQGHEDTVEDVQFCPSSAQEFCSVGDDPCHILWDARVGSSLVVKVQPKAHNADLHCVDWNPHDQNLILTGSADNSVCHKAAWSPDRASVFGSAAEDGFLNIWDHEKVGKKKESAGTRMPNSPPWFILSTCKGIGVITSSLF
ncbi:unnamed protein product [Musa acuminata subsp. burmannicoides]